MKELKLFVGGYYDDRIFEGEEFDGKTPFSKNINTYTLSEALKLGFLEPVATWYKEQYEKEFEEASEGEKIKVVLEYVENDEIAGLLYFETEKEAEDYKIEVLRELEEIESNIKYVGKEQDSEGYFREVYKLKQFQLIDYDTFVSKLTSESKEKIEEIFKKDFEYQNLQEAYDCFEEGYNNSDKDVEAQEFYSDPNEYIEIMYNERHDYEDNLKSMYDNEI